MNYVWNRIEEGRKLTKWSASFVEGCDDILRIKTHEGSFTITEKELKDLLKFIKDYRKLKKCR